MSTPPRLTEVQCPRCEQVWWIIDCDYRGRGGEDLSHRERRYPCPCGYQGPGWTIRQQSPPAFLLQPHDLYPMTQEAFDYWVAILKKHFPDHRAVAELGTTFFPRLPAEVEGMREAHARLHPVGLMEDQDGARRVDPDLPMALDWLEMMRAGDALRFMRREGGALNIEFDGSGYSASCVDESGTVLIEIAGIPEPTVHEAIERYLHGNTSGCLSRIRESSAGALARLWKRAIDP